MRKKLKFKIFSKFGTIKAFAEKIGYTRSHIHAIINKSAIGSPAFWKSVQKELEMDNEELWQYINDNNSKRRKQ